MTTAVAADRPPGRVLAPALLVLSGLAALVASASPAPIAHGAVRLASPEVGLAAFDALVVTLLACPSRAGWSDRLAVALIGVPVHVVLAAAAGASGAHAVVLLLFGGAFGGAAALGARLVGPAARARFGGALALTAFGLPAIAYACGDFLRLDTSAIAAASPVVGPVILARTARDVTLGGAIPAVIAAAALTAVAFHLARRERVATGGSP